MEGHVRRERPHSAHRAQHVQAQHDLLRGGGEPDGREPETERDELLDRRGAPDVWGEEETDPAARNVIYLSLPRRGPTKEIEAGLWHPPLVLHPIHQLPFEGVRYSPRSPGQLARHA